MPSVYIKTYGCQMNERDSEQVAAQLVAKGYTLAPSEKTADVILLNTCSGLFQRRQSIALGHELGGDLFGIALVHLATVSLNINARHGHGREPTPPVRG